MEILIIWSIIIIICITEGYFCSELDDESKNELKNRKK